MFYVFITQSVAIGGGGFAFADVTPHLGHLNNGINV